MELVRGIPITEYCDKKQLTTQQRLDLFIKVCRDISYDITLTASSGDTVYNALAPIDVSTTNLDDDTAGITVTPASGLTTTEAGGTATFTVVLDSQPSGPVTFDLSSSDASQVIIDGVVGNQLTLTFTTVTWNILQPVTVKAVADSSKEFTLGYAIVTDPTTSTDPKYNGIDVADVSVVVVDDDVATLDDFEDGDLSEYKEKGFSYTSVTTAAAFADDDGDGTAYGLQDETNSGFLGWIIRTDAQAQVAQGDIISVWVRSTGTGLTRGYFGFGASEPKGKPATQGTLAMTMGVNSGSLLIHRITSGYDTYEVLGSVGQSWKANHWYRMQVTWQTNGDITGELFDSDGTTLLNTVTGNDTTFTSGGIAFRAFGNTIHFDTAEVDRGGAPAPLATVSAGGSQSSDGSRNQTVFVPFDAELSTTLNTASLTDSSEETVLPQLLIVSPALVIDTDSELEIANLQEDSVTDVEGTAFPDADSSDVAFDTLFTDFEESLADSLLR